MTWILFIDEFKSYRPQKHILDLHNSLNNFHKWSYLFYQLIWDLWNFRSFFSLSYTNFVNFSITCSIFYCFPEIFARIPFSILIYISLLIIDQKLSIRLILGEAEGHAINLASTKPFFFLAKWAIVSFSDYEKGLNLMTILFTLKFLGCKLSD